MQTTNRNIFLMKEFPFKIAILEPIILPKTFEIAMIIAISMM